MMILFFFWTTRSGFDFFSIRSEPDPGQLSPVPQLCWILMSIQSQLNEELMQYIHARFKKYVICPRSLVHFYVASILLKAVKESKFCDEIFRGTREIPYTAIRGGGNLGLSCL